MASPACKQLSSLCDAHRKITQPLVDLKKIHNTGEEWAKNLAYDDLNHGIPAVKVFIN